MSIEKRVLEYVDLHPGKTATQVAHALRARPGTVSGILNRLSKAKGGLKRVDGVGPRGGYGYYPSDFDFEATPKTIWERISD